MKQRLLSLLLAVCLVVSLPAFAAEGDKLIGKSGEDGVDENVRSICTIGDTLYMLSYNGVFYTYNTADGAVSKYEWDSETKQLFRGAERGDDTLYFRILCQFTWRDGLYALTERSYRYAGTDSVELCEVVLSDGAVELTPVCEVDWLPLADYEDFIQINICCTVGDMLCLNAFVGDNTLFLMPLDGSGITETSYIDVEFCAYGDELLIVDHVQTNDSDISLSALNPETGEVRALDTRYASMGFPMGFAYDEKSDCLLFADEGGLVSLNIADSSFETIAPISIFIDNYVNGMCACMLASGAYAAVGYPCVELKQVRGRTRASGTLTIASTYLPDAANKALLEFGNIYPEIEARSIAAGNVLEALLTRSDEADIYILGSYDHSSEIPLAAVLERGWAKELDSSKALNDYVSGMYPSFAEEFMYDGSPIAVPLEGYVYGLGMNIGALKRLGLSVKDVPTDWAGFFDFIASVSENGVVPVLGLNSARMLRESLLTRVFLDYWLEMKHGGYESFDTDELRSILAAFERVDFDAISETDSEFDYSINPLINYYSDTGVSRSAFTDEGDTYYPLRLSISPERPIYMPVQVYAAFINPASKNIETAVKFLELALSYVNPAMLATMNAEYGKPLLDKERYDKYTSEQDAKIEELRASLAAADDSDRHELTVKLEEAIDRRARMENRYWIISPDSLEWYKTNDEHVVIEMPTLISEQNFTDALGRYSNGADDMNELIYEIEKISRLKLLENS